VDSHNLAEDNERALLGAILTDNSLLGDINDILKGEDFYFERHATIYNASVYKYMCGEPVDTITISNFLRDSGKLDRVGGASYLSELSDVCPDVSNAISYAEGIKQYALARGIEKLSSDMASGLESKPPREIIDFGLSQLIKLSEASTDSNQVPVSSIVDRTVDKLIAVHDGEREQQKYVLTGFTQVDRILSGLRPKDMFVIAARPSIGKTALATNIAVNVARHNHPVLFFSIEMDKERLVHRILAAETGIPYRLIDNEMLKAEHIEKLRAAKDIFSRIPLFIDDCSKQSLVGMRTKVRRQMAKTGLSLVIVDYLQLACKDPEDRNEIAMWSSGLKSIAKDVGVTMMPLLQLNRYVEHRDDPRPNLADIKGSSQPEQDADIVAFIWHKNKNNMLDKTLSFAKHRNGPLGEVEFKFNNATTVFSEKVSEFRDD
jgi:replicative DNA helicase